MRFPSRIETCEQVLMHSGRSKVDERSRERWVTERSKLVTGPADTTEELGLDSIRPLTTCVRRRLCSCHQSKRCLRRSPFSCVNSLSRREVSQFIHFLFNISNRYMKTLSLSLRSYSYITVFFCVKETGGFRGYFRTPKFPRNLKCNVWCFRFFFNMPKVT